MPIKTVQNVSFLALLLLTTLAFLGLIQDFLLPVFWATVLAIAFHPVHQRWLRLLGGRASPSAILTIVTIIVVVVLPLSLVGLAVARESMALYRQIASGEIDLREPIRFIEGVAPSLTAFLEQFGIDPQELSDTLREAVVTVTQFIVSQAVDIGQNVLRVGVMFFLMVYVLFFFLRDGDRYMEAIIRALPLGDVRERRLFSKFAEVSRAALKGTLVVGVVQGTLGGLLFWILGIGAPVFWGVMMAVLSLLPVLGTALVWVPTAVILLMTGKIVEGIILLVAGTFVVGLVDNMLRPYLVGRDTQMPDFLVLLATLGGLAIFGLSGFVIGPIVAAFFLVVWEMFEQEYGSKDDVEVAVDE